MSRHFCFPTMKSFLFVLLLSAVAVTSRAETRILLARYDGAWLPVTAVNTSTPLVLRGGKLVAASRDAGYKLAKVKTYWKGVPAPTLVTVSGVSAHSSNFHVGQMGGIEHDVYVVSGTIHSPDPLTHVYVVFDVHTPAGDRALMVREIGTLEAGSDRAFEFAFPTSVFSGQGKFYVHLFSNGLELLQTAEGWAAIRSDIERRVAANIEGVRNEGPRPYYVVVPARPASMGDNSPVRQVDVIATIASDGSVSAANATKGAPPDYATAAERAVSSYFFLPKIVNGKPSACRVDIAVQFDPKLDRSHG